MTFSDERLNRRAMLVGSPRSGTTWLAKIVDSHPSVLYRHEPDSINVRIDIPFVPQKGIAIEDIAASREYLMTLWEESAIKSSGSQPMFAKNYRGLLNEFARRLVIFGLKVGERMSGKDSFFSSLQVPDLVARKASADTLLFIKSVSSLCRANMFSLADPQLQFIHIIRHPCAYVASTIRGNKLGYLSDDAYIETLAKMPEGEPYGLSLEKLRSMSREEQLAARWMLQNEKVIREMENSDRYMQLVYEDLCADPLRVTEGLFDFLGLSMMDQTRDFIAESSSGKTSDVRYFDVRRDSASAATGWMKELNESQIKAIRDVVSDSVVGKIYFPDPV